MQSRKAIAGVRWVGAVVIAAALAGCGAGGGMSQTAPTAPAQTPNRTPTISGPATATVAAGQAYTYTPTAADADGNALTFTVSGKPAWLTLNSSTGALSGTPTASDVGAASFRITVSDGSASASLDVTLTVVAAGGGARTATLSWVPPTARTDGSALTNLAGYRIYYGPSQSAMTTRADVNNPSLSTYVVEGLTPGTWYFAATSVDANGRESDRTPTVSLTIS